MKMKKKSKLHSPEISGFSSPRIEKTIKLFIGGEFPRTESGRSFPVYKHKSKEIYANLCKASRKDLRNAVTVAQAAQPGWQARAAYNRSQILYRMAEMAEGKRDEFVGILIETLGYDSKLAHQAVDQAVEAFVYYSGFADKYQQILGCMNPVSGPHHNFTAAEPVGVVGLLCEEKFNLAKVVAQICAIIVSGNSVVALMSTNGAALLAPLSEVFATSDLPKGIVNLLTGEAAELLSHFGNHMEIQSVSCQLANEKLIGEIKGLATSNLKRVVLPIKDSLSLDHLSQYLEYKTVWHPVGY